MHTYVNLCRILTEEELACCIEIKDSLEPLKAVTEALSDQTLTVTQAEVAFNFAVEVLESNGGDFARRMAKSLQSRYILCCLHIIMI